MTDNELEHYKATLELEIARMQAGIAGHQPGEGVEASGRPPAASG
jgi:hypothetical protein